MNHPDRGTQRRIMMEVCYAALRSVAPGPLLTAAVHPSGNYLEIGGRPYSLTEIRRIVAVGAGKAALPMAEALEGLLGNRLEQGVVCDIRAQGAATRMIRVREGGHPLPDNRGLDATREIVALLQQLDREDLALVLLSGGGSALLTLPPEGIALEDKSRAARLLMEAGATIHQINTVRKHLSLVKGGGLARYAYPAQVVTLVLSDVVGNPLDVIASGPTCPDPSSYREACALMDSLGLWRELPTSAADRLHLGAAGGIPETPKEGDPVFDRVQNLLIGSSKNALEGASARARELGFDTALITDRMEGEARQVGTELASLAIRAARTGTPVARPCCLLAAGETTVRLRGKGRGGRNQELALAAAIGIHGAKGVAIAALATDGVDGPTPSAGAIAYGDTLDRAASLGLDAASALDDNDSFSFFDSLGDTIVTGLTRTNVSDLVLLFAF